MDVSLLTPTRQPSSPEPIGQDSYTPDEIDAQKAELERAIQEQEAAKQRAQDAKDRLEYMIARVDIPASEFKSWVFDTYWNTEGCALILQGLVKKRLGEAYNLWKEIIEGAAEWPCDKCGQKVKRIFASKTAYNEARTKRGRSFLCPSCQEEKERADKARSIQWQMERETRSERLSELKSMPYGEYLKTPEWDETRKAALKRAGYHCQLCNAQGQLHVHHKTYERRGEEYAKDLIVLCADCHAKHHDKDV